MNLAQVFARPRQVSCRWHYEQAKALLEFATTTGSATALVYAALEARLSVERCIFEAGVLIRGGAFSPDELRRALAKKGLNTFLSNLVGDWRRYLEFSAEVAGLQGIPLPPQVVLRAELLQKSITQLSSYCHWIADPTTTIEHPSLAWFSKGVTAVDEALAHVSSSPYAALAVSSLPPEVQALWERYRDQQVDLESLRIKLRLMQPVLESRLRSGP